MLHRSTSREPSVGKRGQCGANGTRNRACDTGRDKLPQLSIASPEFEERNYEEADERAESYPQT